MEKRCLQSVLMRIYVQLTVAALLLASGCAGPRQSLSGSVHGPSYTSSQGNFSVPFPVSPDVGGKVLSDGPRTVTFTDNWGARITFSALPFKQQSAMTSTLQKDGIEKALTELARRNYGTSIQTHFNTNVLGGAVTFAYQRATGQKTGVAAFVHGYSVYLVETDLLPGVQILARNDEQSVLERDHWLEGRALTLAQSMEIK